MNPNGKLKHYPSGVELDMIVLDLEGAAALLEAVQVAVEAGNLPRDVCAAALSSLDHTFYQILKELRAEIYEDAANDEPP